MGDHFRALTAPRAASDSGIAAVISGVFSVCTLSLSSSLSQGPRRSGSRPGRNYVVTFWEAPSISTTLLLVGNCGPLPLNPQQEHDVGERLTKYLRRGSDDPLPDFKDD